MAARKKRRLLNRRKRSLDPNTIIDYKRPDILKRFITDRGKIIPRRISGATAAQQRAICTAVKRARYLALIPCSTAHRNERGFSGMVSMSYAIFDRNHKPLSRGGSSHHSSHSNNSGAPQEQAAPKTEETTANTGE